MISIVVHILKSLINRTALFTNVSICAKLRFFGSLEFVISVNGCFRSKRFQGIFISLFKDQRWGRALAIIEKMPAYNIWDGGG